MRREQKEQLLLQIKQSEKYLKDLLASVEKGDLPASRNSAEQLTILGKRIAELDQKYAQGLAGTVVSMVELLEKNIQLRELYTSPILLGQLVRAQQIEYSATVWKKSTVLDYRKTIVAKLKGDALPVDFLINTEGEERWVRPEGIAAIYLNRHGKEVWIQILSQSTPDSLHWQISVHDPVEWPKDSDALMVGRVNGDVFQVYEEAEKITGAEIPKWY